MRRFVLLAAMSVLAVTPPLAAQVPLTTYADAFEARRARSQPNVRYTIHVDARDLGGYDVEMQIRNAPDTLRLALPIWAPGAYRVVNFSRNLRDLVVLAGTRTVPVIATDSSRWRAVVPGGVATVRYRIQYPSAAAASTPNNRSFLRSTGALIDGPATFLYLEDMKLLPAHVSFEVPPEWRIATGLVPTSDAHTFFAPSYDALIDSPVLLGEIYVAPFVVDGMPHRVAYWIAPNAPPFDTARFANAARTIVSTARDIMGELPYREYTFLFVDSAGGGLEHLNSTTIGARSEALGKNPLASTGVTAHEFFHLWNVKRIRPAVLGPFDYQHPVRTTDLWWSEGVTDFFGSEIERRAGFLDEQAARDAIAENIASYLGNPAHARISPERSSWTAWDTPEANGGYSISYYLQGALLGELLELQLRDATGNARGMDDVARTLFDRYAAARGFTGEDLLHVVNETCGCDLQPFFDRHVSGAAEIDFDHYLALAGWKTVVVREPAMTAAGAPAPDLRVSVTPFAGIGSAGGAAGGRPRLSVPTPLGAWGRAGLVSGDELISVNGRPIANAADFRDATAHLVLGDVVRVEYQHRGVRHSTSVSLTRYDTTRVAIVDLPNITARQRALRAVWMKGPGTRD